MAPKKRQTAPAVTEKRSKRRNDSAAQPTPSRPTPPPTVREDRPFGIVFQQPYESERFKRIANREYSSIRYLHSEMLDQYGLYEKFGKLLEKMDWKNFAETKVPVYKNLTVEFLCSMDHNYGEVLRFRLKNKQYSIPLFNLSTFLKLPYHRFSSDEMLLYDANNFWTQITGREELYERKGGQESFITDPYLRILHRFIAFTFNARKESTEVVLKEDLIVLWCAVRERREYNVLNNILELFRRSSEKGKGTIMCGNFVTIIAESLGLDLSLEEEYKIDYNRKDDLKNLLHGMKLIKKQGKEGNKVKYVSNVVEIVEEELDEPAGEFPELPAPPIPASSGPSASSSGPSERLSFEDAFQALMTEIGTIKGKISTIETNVAKLQSDVADIKEYLGAPPRD